jgi:Flp pilus assembly protein TadG
MNLLRRRDRGSASIELAVLTPAVIAFFAAVVIAGRITLALQAADSAAYDAARTASLARDATTARVQALSAATASFTAQGITCRSVTVNVDTTGFSIPVGQPATVRVTVSCVAELRDVALPGMPGSTTLSSSFVSPLDRYRSRSPS